MPSNAYIWHVAVNVIIIGSDNGLPDIRHQAISFTNADLLLVGSIATNFSEI